MNKLFTTQAGVTPTHRVRYFPVPHFQATHMGVPKISNVGALQKGPAHGMGAWLALKLRPIRVGMPGLLPLLADWSNGTSISTEISRKIRPIASRLSRLLEVIKSKTLHGSIGYLQFYSVFISRRCDSLRLLATIIQIQIQFQFQ